jgi:hypothetical protein
MVSIGTTSLAAITGIAVAVVTGSSATLVTAFLLDSARFSLDCGLIFQGYGLENFIDIFSSAIVLWRFWISETDAHSSAIIKVCARRTRILYTCFAGVVCVNAGVGFFIFFHLDLEQGG